MLRITEEDYIELLNILEGYTQELNSLDVNSQEYEDLKQELDNKFCSINMLQEHQIIHNEINLGNVSIKNDVLTCINNNEIHRYKMTNRKAKNGELVYIVNATDSCPFNKRYIGRCFRISKQPTKEELEWVKDFVVVNIDGLDVGWCLYDDQYIVLEELSCK